MSQKSIIAQAVQLKQNPHQSSGVAGPGGANVQGQMQNRGSMAQPMQQQLSMQQQRVGGKRSSTSPGEEVRCCPPGHHLDIDQLITYRFVSTEYYPETSSPRPIVSANARPLRILGTSSSSSSSSNNNNSNRNSNRNRNNNNNNRNSNRNNRSTSTSSRSPNHRHSNSHNHRHSNNSNNLRWRPSARFRRVYSPCPGLDLCGACICPAGRALPVDLVAH